MGGPEARGEPTLLHTVLGSSLSGLVSRAICHPVDTVKSRLQAAGGSRYTGALHCCRATLAKEGVRGLYAGFGAVAVVGTPAACVYLTSYEALKGVLGAEGSELAFMGHLAAGMGAEAVSCLFFVPVDVVKERLQVQGVAAGKGSSAPPAYSGSLDAFRVISRTEGLFGIYKGYFATLASFGPFSALYFALYEAARGALAQATGAPGKAQLSPACTLTASAAAGAAASVITCPLDLAKLRMQTQRRLRPGEAVPESHLGGLLSALRAVAQEGGVRALFRGAGARAAFHTPSTCIMFTCFEECRRLVQRLV